MIGNFKNTDPGIESCDFVNMLSDYNAFTDLFVCESTFFFSGESSITDQSEWKENITLKHITPLYHVKEIEVNNEDPVRYTGVQDIELEIYKGKYKYDLYFNYDINLYNKVNKLHNKPAYIYLFDKNDNIYGRLNGTDIYGIRCELFAVSKLIFGETQNPSGIKISIVIDGDESVNIRAYDKEFTALDIIYSEDEDESGLTYTITNVTSSTPQSCQVTIQDSESNAVESLLSTAFTITDSLNGNLTIDTFTESSPGVYDITLTTVISSGTIYVNVPPLISYVYSLRSLSTIYNLSFGNNWYAHSSFGFDQNLYNGWSSVFTWYNDYEFDFDGNDDLVINIYQTGADILAFGMQTDNQILEAGKDYIVELSYKSNYETTGIYANPPNFGGDGITIGYGATTAELERFDVEVTASFIHISKEITVPSDYALQIVAYNFPRYTSDIEIIIESIKVYEVLT